VNLSLVYETSLVQTNLESPVVVALGVDGSEPWVPGVAHLPDGEDCQVS